MKNSAKALRRIAPVLFPVLLIALAAPAVAAGPVKPAVPANQAPAPQAPAPQAPAPQGPATQAGPVQAIVLPLVPVVAPTLRSCPAKTASGLGTLNLKPSTAAKPAKTDIVLVNYIGYLAATGAVFDQGMQAAFPAEGVIPGFAEGLQLMAKGSMWRFCVPAAQGYGAQASGPIPANSDLVFQVELLDFKTAAEVEAMRVAQGGQQQPPTNPK